MSDKFKYSAEFELFASVKMVFPYLSTPSGLKEWFCDDVNLDAKNNLLIDWDGDIHPAKFTNKRTNNHIRIQFLPLEDEENSKLSYVDFKIDHNEMTQTTFLKVIDYSEMDNEEDLDELWNRLIGHLKEIVGG